MEIDTTTFILELINFIVLVWILHRFLFRPVMSTMDKRRAAIDADISKARELREAADKLRAQYEGRLDDWEKEKASAREVLNKELADRRAQGVAQAREAATQEAQRLARTEDQRRAAWERVTERRAMEQGAQFTARLLDRLSGPELDQGLARLFMEDLGTWPREKLDVLIAAAREAQGKVTVASARPLPAEVRQELERSLTERLGISIVAEYVIDSSVISGMRLTFGAWLIQADVGDELAFFAREALNGA